MASIERLTFLLNLREPTAEEVAEAKNLAAELELSASFNARLWALEQRRIDFAPTPEEKTAETAAGQELLQAMGKA